MHLVLEMIMRSVLTLKQAGSNGDGGCLFPKVNSLFKETLT